MWFSADFNGPGTGDDAFTTYYHDSLGRRIYQDQNVAGLGSKTITHEWQGATRLVSETYPSGRVVNRSYDPLGRLDEASEGVMPFALIASKAYIGWRELQLAYGNGTTLTKADPTEQRTTDGATAGYDAKRRHIRHEWKSGSTTITNYGNTYNLTNRRLTESRAHLSHTDSYEFDSAYRMVEFVRNGSITSTRSLDGADKMTAFSDEGTAQNPVVDGDPSEDGLNQYSEFAGADRIYNDNGGLADQGEGGQKFVYDAQNRLVSVSRWNELLEEDELEALYLYDADNRRVLRAVVTPSGISLTRYTYSGWRVLEEVEVFRTTTTIREFVDGDGIDEHLQMRVTVGESVDEYWYHCNSQGFVGALTDSSGNVVETYEYKWLGEPVATSTVGNPYLWQGRHFDSETGLYQFRNRYYDPSAGEFVTVDPSGLWTHGQGNGFSAFNEDPRNVSDPWGEFPWLLVLLVPLPFLESCGPPGCNVGQPAIDAANIAGSETASVATATDASDPGGMEYCGMICCDPQTGRVFRTGPVRGPRPSACVPRSAPCPPGTMELGAYHSHTRRHATVRRATPTELGQVGLAYLFILVADMDISSASNPLLLLRECAR